MGIIADNAKRIVETEFDIACTSIWLDTFKNVVPKIKTWVRTPEIDACEEAIESFKRDKQTDIDQWTTICLAWGFAVVKSQGEDQYVPEHKEKVSIIPVDEPVKQAGQADFFGCLSNYGARRSGGESSNKR